MIKFSKVSLIYPQSTTTVIEDLSFEISEGEMVLVMGHTGVGKSSLLKLMNGLVPHHTGGILAGEVIVDGISTRTVRPGELSGIIGIVGQNPIDTFIADTVEEEIAFGMESLNIPPDVMRKRVEEVLDQVSLAPLRNRSIATLSGGEQQRVAIAAALVTHPKVLVLDEPTSALDPIAAEEILALLHRLVHDLSITVIIAEHRLERVIGYVDRILLIAEDGSATLGAPDQILQTSDLVPPIVALSRALKLPSIGLSTREVRKETTSIREKISDATTPLASFNEVVMVATDVLLKYDSKVALNKVSLQLRAGEITALMGRNGAGKSSLIRTLTGLEHNFQGSVLHDGKAITTYSPADRATLIGYIPQDPGDLLYHSTVAQECEQGDKDAALPTGSTLALLQKSLPTINPASNPRDLSEGERLSLALAIVLIGKPRILILDEPTRGLDYVAKENLIAQLKEIAKVNQATILMATHDVELVAEVADRTIFLSEGEIVADGPTLDILLASPAFAPQVAKVMSPKRWLTVSDVLDAIGGNA